MLKHLKKAAILLRGESFRLGSQNQRNIGSDESKNDQILAFETHIKLINNIRKHFNLDVFLDTISTKFDDIILNKFNFAKKISIHQKVKETQTESLARAVEPILLDRNFNEYNFLLILRNDIFLKDLFIEKYNPFSNKVLYTSVCWYKDRCYNNLPRPADLVMHIPKRYNLLLKHLGFHTGHESISYWREVLPDFEFDFLVNTYHDSDTEKDWNPLYYITNRPRKEEPEMNSDKSLKYPGDFFKKTP